MPRHRGRHHANRFSVRVSDLLAGAALEICESIGAEPLGPLDRAKVKLIDGRTIVFWDSVTA